MSDSQKENIGQIKKKKCYSFKSPGGHLSQWDLRQRQPTCVPKPEQSKAAISPQNLEDKVPIAHLGSSKPL